MRAPTYTDTVPAAKMPPAVSAPPLLTVKELAQVLNIPRSNVYEHASSWPHLRVGRQLRFELPAVLEHLRQSSA